MKFERKIGWEFDWYAVDSVGSIALFASGRAAVPKMVFEDESKYLKVIDHFENLPKITNARLSVLYESKKNDSLNEFANQTLEAERGIYTFYDKYYTNIYELISLPDEEIKIEHLPDEIKKFLELFRFKDLVFAETESIEVTKFFECDEKSW